jgi:hypothetical protein
MSRVKKQFKEIEKQLEARRKYMASKQPKVLKAGDKDWEDECSVCGSSPTVHPTGLCGPCCFGEADTWGGNW